MLRLLGFLEAQRPGRLSVKFRMLTAEPPALSERARELLLPCGVAASLVYGGTDRIAADVYPGFSFTDARRALWAQYRHAIEEALAYCSRAMFDGL